MALGLWLRNTRKGEGNLETINPGMGRKGLGIHNGGKNKNK